MSARPEVLEMTRRWIQRADRHLDAAVVLSRCEDLCVYDATCYHAEEAVRTYLTAMLTLYQIMEPRTHDLAHIHDLLPAEARVSIDPRDLAYMSTYGIERYWDPDRAQADRAVAIARDFQQKLKSQLQPELRAA